MPGSEIPLDGPNASGRSTLIARDGVELAIEWQIPRECRGQVVVLHGYAEHKGRYGHVASALFGAGYGCHLLDLRGHGLSGGDRGAVSRFADYRFDLDLVLEHVRSPGTEAGGPVWLVAHSLGGLIALDYALHRPAELDALAVSSPFLAPHVPRPLTRLVGPAARLMPWLVERSGIDARWLSHDAEIVKAYRDDPLVFERIDPHWFVEAVEAQKRVFERAGEIRLPILFQLGGDDRIADPSRSEAVFERLGSDDKRLVVYDDHYHEIFNETGRARVIEDLLGWLRSMRSDRL